MDKYLGRKCRDKITWIEGVCTGKIAFISGCDQYILEMRDKNKATKIINIDVGRLEVIEDILDFERLTQQEQSVIFETDMEQLCEKYLGKSCRDKISGFEGVCTSVIVGLYHPAGVNLMSRNEKPNPPKLTCDYFDIGRIEVVKDCVSPEDVRADKNGGFHGIEEFGERWYSGSFEHIAL